MRGIAASPNRCRVRRLSLSKIWFIKILRSKPGRVMKPSTVNWACLPLVLAGFAFGADVTLPSGGRKIAITFDDLPAVSVPAGETCDLAALKANTAKLLATLTSQSVPV